MARVQVDYSLMANKVNQAKTWFTLQISEGLDP